MGRIITSAKLEQIIFVFFWSGVNSLVKNEEKLVKVARVKH